MSFEHYPSDQKPFGFRDLTDDEYWCDTVDELVVHVEDRWHLTLTREAQDAISANDRQSLREFINDAIEAVL